MDAFHVLLLKSIRLSKKGKINSEREIEGGNNIMHKLWQENEQMNEEVAVSEERKWQNIKAAVNQKTT